MAKLAEHPIPKSGSRASRIATLAKSMPRMPAAQQRRLSALIAKGKSGKLSAAEDRELRTLLDSIDRRNYWNLAQAIELEARSTQPRRPRKTG